MTASSGTLEGGGDDLILRPAHLDDLPRLLQLEERCFAGDRQSRRSFRHLLTRGHTLFDVAVLEGALVGYVVVLLRNGSEVARCYSLAVDPAAQGQQVGRRLLGYSEARAQQRGRRVMRLEVRCDNARAIDTYRRAGYREIARQPGYYADGAMALRMEKALAAPGSPG